MTRLIAVLFAVFLFAFSCDTFAQQSLVGDLHVDDVHKKVKIAFLKDKTGLVFTHIPRYRLEIAYADIDSVKFAYTPKGIDPGAVMLGGLALGLMTRSQKIPMIALYANGKVYYLTKFNQGKGAYRFWSSYFPRRSKIKLIDGDKWKME